MINLAYLLSVSNKKVLAKQHMWQIISNPKGVVYLFGINYWSKKLINIINIDAIIDDFADIQSYQNIPVYKSQQIHFSEEIVIINCVLDANTKSAYNKISKLGFKFIINYTELHYFDPNIPQHSSVVDTIQCYDKTLLTKLYNNLYDDESKQVLTDIMSYRLTGDLTYLTNYSYRPNDQYFDECMNYEEEIFVDAGGFDGDTAELFLKKHPKTTKYFFLEPNIKYIEKAKNRLKLFTQVEYIQLGASNKKDNLHFNSQNGSASTISQSGDAVIQVDTIDSIVCKNASTIKMDIEGHELKAIEGAKETIKKSHPKLAICVYHKGEDIYQVFNKIMNIRDDYMIYLRHYSESFIETVMYFVPLKKK